MLIHPRLTLPSQEGNNHLMQFQSATTSQQAIQEVRSTHLSRRIFGFSVVGGSVMVGGIAFLFAMIQIFHVEKHLAYLIQALVSIEVNFLLNRFINWKDRTGNFLLQWLKFHSTSAVTFPLNQALFALFTLIGLPYLFITVMCAGVAALVNYFANDRFVFHQRETPYTPHVHRLSSIITPHPHVGIVLPVRNAQRSIRDCLSSLLTQDYAGQISIFLVGNVPEQDATWSVLDDFLEDARIHAVQIQRPSIWTGRDANMKRYCGCEAALSAGVDVLAFTDSQVLVPTNWLSSAIGLLQSQEVDGIAGRSCRKYADTSLPSVYQDSSLFSEWPRYSTGFHLSKQNFQQARGLPVTNNLIISRDAWLRVRHSFPLNTAYSWEDFRFSWELACAGCVIYCTDSVYVYRNHRSRFRLAKHIAAGAGAFTFYQEHPTCIYAKRMLWKASGVTVGALLVSVAFFTTLFSGNLLLLSALLGVCVFLFAIFGIYSAVKSRDVRGLCFPLLDTLHVGLWIAGAVTIAWQKEENNTEFAELLVQLR